ncbi:MAG: Hha/YmoA family nucleoid-associated regulatory protein [Arsenophonus sp. NC-PE1-MAG3]
MQTLVYVIKKNKYKLYENEFKLFYFGANHKLTWVPYE